MYGKVIKRMLDFMVATVVLILLIPVFFLVTLLLWINNNGKPFFIQMRPGANCVPFYVMKFRTMNDRRAPSGELLPDDKRLTRVGKFIRRTSLDEIPQLLNVIKGDMSLVGPRPLLMEYLSLYSPEQKRRHEVKPGITGWAQVNGRNAIGWKERFALDVWYVEHLSFRLDVKILFLTVQKVFKAEGISSATSVTMENFKGNHS